MKRNILILIAACAALMCACAPKVEVPEVDHNALRAPGYPLVSIDPNTSAWSLADHLYDENVKHWTGKEFPLLGVLTVDGQAYRFMGGAAPGYETAAEQLYADVQATQTHYAFNCGPVELDVTFLAPLFMDDLELVSRPVNYITYTVLSKDGKKHDASIFFEASPLWSVNKPDQETVSETFEQDGIVYLKAGSVEQNILGAAGDDRRIDWGYFYLAAEKAKTTAAVGENGVLQLSRKIGKVAEAQGKVLIGYDDLYSIQYFGDNLRPYWNRNGDKTIQDAFNAALKDYPALVARAYAFDEDLMARAEKAGGRKYAELCALAYRQSIHAHKLVQAPNGDLLWLSKENNSNGSIGTVDVTYPSAPLFLIYNVELAKGLMNHIYYYSESGKWTKPFPAHDVGKYPLANGQRYGADMPVEEGGNMLILTAAVCEKEGSYAYAQKHWETLKTWTEYLTQFGLDPEEQLCTDDFAGHFAHNINLSAKAIVGIASFAKMAAGLGHNDTAQQYMELAREMASKWVEMADDGDHYKLTFDKKGTWSQKYNIVWDKLLGLNIFPDDVMDKEIPYYLTVQNEYGLPLDSRMAYTKLDWIMWTATMAKDAASFEAFVDPVYKWVNETIDRVPMSDWTWTDSPKHRGFKARSVVGGYFIKMMAEEQK